MQHTIVVIAGMCFCLVITMQIGCRIWERPDHEVTLRRTLLPFCAIAMGTLVMVHDTSLSMSVLLWYGATIGVALPASRVHAGQRYHFTLPKSSLSLPERAESPPGPPSVEETASVGSSSGQQSSQGANNGRVVRTVSMAHDSSPMSSSNVSRQPSGVAVQVVAESKPEASEAPSPRKKTSPGVPNPLDLSLVSDDDTSGDQNPDDLNSPIAIARSKRRPIRMPVSVEFPGCVGDASEIRNTFQQFKVEAERLQKKGDYHHPPSTLIQLMAGSILGPSATMSNPQPTLVDRVAEVLPESPKVPPAGGPKLFPTAPFHITTVIWIVAALICHLGAGVAVVYWRARMIQGGHSSAIIRIDHSSVMERHFPIEAVDLFSQLVIWVALLVNLVPLVRLHQEEDHVLQRVVDGHVTKHAKKIVKDRAVLDAAFRDVNILSDIAIASGKDIYVCTVPALEDGSTPRFVAKERRLPVAPFGGANATTRKSFTAVRPLIYELCEAAFVAGCDYADKKTAKVLRQSISGVPGVQQQRSSVASSGSRPPIGPRRPTQKPILGGSASGPAPTGPPSIASSYGGQRRVMGWLGEPGDPPSTLVSPSHHAVADGHEPRRAMPLVEHTTVEVVSQPGNLDAVEQRSEIDIEPNMEDVILGAPPGIVNVVSSSSSSLLSNRKSNES